MMFAMLEILNSSMVFSVYCDRKMETMTRYRVMMERVVTLLNMNISDVCLYSCYSIEIYDIQLGSNRCEH